MGIGAWHHFIDGTTLQDCLEERELGPGTIFKPLKGGLDESSPYKKQFQTMGIGAWHHFQAPTNIIFL
jgi:hypothetical protein